MSKNYLCVLMGLLMVSSINHCSIFQADLLSKDNRVVFWKDYHPKNLVGYKHFFGLLAGLKTLGAPCIVEDMEVVNRQQNPEFYSGAFSKILPLSYGQTPLLGFYYFCKAFGIDAENVEFRRYTQELEQQLMNGDIDTLCAFLLKSEMMCAEIEEYNDTPEFNKKYKEIVSSFKNEILYPVINALKNLKKSGARSVLQAVSRNMPDEIVQFLYKDRVQTARRLGANQEKAEEWAQQAVANSSAEQQLDTFLVEFCASLLDCRILHALHTYRDKPVIFVYAGGFHTHNVMDILKELGYEQRTTVRSKVNAYDPIDLNEFFKEAFGQEIMTLMKHEMAELLTTFKESLPEQHPYREEWLAMISKEHQDWNSIGVHGNFLGADIENSDWSNWFSNVASVVFPFGFADTISSALAYLPRFIIG